MKYAFAVIILLLLTAFFLGGASYPTRKKGNSISCDDKTPQLVRVAMGRITVINFPFKPKEVVPGNMNFDFKQIKNDLAIKALRLGARTNVLVYLEGRRCSFDLVAISGRGNDILIVEDDKDSLFEVLPQ